MESGATEIDQDVYKVVALVDGHLLSIFDGATEYVIGTRRDQLVLPGRGGGFYVYRTAEEALRAEFPKRSRLLRAPRALLRCRAHGMCLPYENGILAVSGLTPLEANQEAVAQRNDKADNEKVGYRPPNSGRFNELVSDVAPEATRERKTMKGRRGMPQTMSDSTLDGVYGKRQPGAFSSGLDRRSQRESKSLRRSASLVLGQGSGCLKLSSEPSAHEVYDCKCSACRKQQRTGTVEGSGHRVVGFSGHESESLPPLQGALEPQDGQSGSENGGMPSFHDSRRRKWIEQSTLLEDVPARLEGCRQRLAAAERELTHCSPNSLKRWKATPEVDYAGENYMLQRHLDDVTSSKDVPAWRYDEDSYLKDRPRSRGVTYSDSLRSKPQSPLLPPSSATASFALGEPAPEPPLPTSAPGGWEAAAISSDLASRDEALERAADEHVEDLRTHLSSIEEQLIGLDKKWRHAERQTEEMNKDRTDLASKLKASEEREKIYQRKLDTFKAEAKSLRTSLGVSEGEAQDMRIQLSTLERKEAILHNQVNALHARIYAAEGDNDVLREQLHTSQQDQEALLERLRHAEEAHEAAAKAAAQREIEAQEAFAKREAEAQKALQEAWDAAAKAREDSKQVEEKLVLEKTQTETKYKLKASAYSIRAEHLVQKVYDEISKANEAQKSLSQNMAKVCFKLQNIDLKKLKENAKLEKEMKDSVEKCIIADLGVTDASSMEIEFTKGDADEEADESEAGHTADEKPDEGDAADDEKDGGADDGEDSKREKAASSKYPMRSVAVTVKMKCKDKGTLNKVKQQIAEKTQEMTEGVTESVKEIPDVAEVLADPSKVVTMSEPEVTEVSASEMADAWTAFEASIAYITARFQETKEYILDNLEKAKDFTPESREMADKNLKESLRKLEVVQPKMLILQAKKEEQREVFAPLAARKSVMELTTTAEVATNTEVESPPQPDFFMAETDLISKTDSDSAQEDHVYSKLSMLLGASISPYSEKPDTEENPKAKLRPFQVMVDISKEELRLVPLGPTGDATVIPFKEMANIKKDDEEFSIDIDWASSSLVTDPKDDTTSMQRVHLDTDRKSVV